MFYLIIICVVIIFLIIYYRQSSISATETFSQCDDTFLSYSDVANFIGGDLDGYIHSLSSADLSARNTLFDYYYQQAIIQNIYIATDEQKKKLIALLQRSNDLLKKQYPDIAATKCKIAFTKNNVYENGLPHTRQYIIFLSNDIFNMSDNEIIRILIHEKIHIFQRYNPLHKYIIDYFDNNNYKRFMTREEYKKTYPLIRANPDLDEWIYINKTDTLASSYNSRKPKSINDVNNQNEHPYENMAYDISTDIYSRL